MYLRVALLPLVDLGTPSCWPSFHQAICPRPAFTRSCMNSLPRETATTRLAVATGSLVARSVASMMRVIQASNRQFGEAHGDVYYETTHIRSQWPISRTGQGPDKYLPGRRGQQPASVALPGGEAKNIECLDWMRCDTSWENRYSSKSSGRGLGWHSTISGERSFLRKLGLL